MIGHLVEENKEIKNHMSKLTNALAVGEHEKFSAQAQPNPKRQHMVQTSRSKETNFKEVNAITTRLEKVVEPTPPFRENEKEPSKPNESSPSEEVVENLARISSSSQVYFEINSLLDFETNVNLMPYAIYLLLGLGEMKPTSMVLQLADRSTIQPREVVEDVTFLATANALINCKNCLMKLTLENMTLEVNIFHVTKEPTEANKCHQTYMIDAFAQEEASTTIDYDLLNSFHLNYEISYGFNVDEYANICAIFAKLQDHRTSPWPELKQLPTGLKHVFLGPGWTITDIKGISPLICSHIIHLEEGTNPRREPQSRLNPTMKEVIKNEIVNGLVLHRNLTSLSADHLSRLTFEDNSNTLPIRDEFPDENLFTISSLPWFANIVNYLAAGEIPKERSAQDMRKFLVECDFYWPTLFKDTDAYCRSCERYQKLGAISHSNMMPLNPILVVEVFDCWCIDFTGPFPSSFSYLYIIVAVDYVSKWVEAVVCGANDNKTVVKFLKENALSRFGTPRVIVSDRGTHFCNRSFEALMKKYGAIYKISTSYHPQNSGQVELGNGEIKQILKKTVNLNRKDWSLRLNDALWAYHTTF
ncbi:uncharacterized protein LOC111406875 [Olea europaea var. sylvestris]|uniref:uncharacterized protein LOC111406875 n=1 Tax=Olea europaea var. sylvestris TaxID=158386 RepID=UPI000C1D62CA|nr:uncharacterized protein LOC111406875 [Olea europaea var. sylvestris]